MSEAEESKEIWPQLLQDFKKSFPSDIYETWFKPLEAEMEDGGTFVLRARNEFAAIWLEDNYMEMIRDKVRAFSGENLDIRFCARESRKETPSSREGLTTENVAEKRNASTAGRPEPKRKYVNAYINPRNTFDNFIVGSSNQLAHAAATAVAASPGTAYNPLFVYGDTGLGKTHLMHAMAHAIQLNNPRANVVYLSCEKFTNKFLTAIRENTLDAFRRFYRKVDVLLIDDIQFLEGKERTQEEFFHTFNELFETQRQLCLSSDRPASEISRLENRLVSRFQWGMVTDIQAPDLETRVAILKKKAIALGFGGLPEEVLEFLASRISRNVRRLEGALIKVATYSRLVQGSIDVRIAENLVQDILQEEAQNRVSVEGIQKKVADHYDLRISELLGRRRPSHIAFPRQIAMYLTRLLTNHPLKEIGDSFGGRDHGTVIHACKTVENIMEQDESVRRNVDYLIRQLNGSPRD